MENNLHIEFDKYVHTFNMHNKRIKYKYTHSYAVEKLMELLAIRFNLNNDDIELAKTIGILHDIGRFKQETKYHTYLDNPENDHAILGIKYLFDEGNIRVFCPDDKNDDIIKKAILNHNKYQIEDNLNERELLFARMIRDMDKVDIYRVVATEYQTRFNNNYNQKKIDAFLEYKQCNTKKVDTISDSVVNKLAFIYDINYQESFKILKEKDYYQLFINSIIVNKDCNNLFNKLVDIGKKYIEERSENNVR